MKTIKNLTSDQIRKSILQLAIQGKLVKQDPNDEPASELVKRIYEEKQFLIKEGKIKKDKNESYIYKGDDNCYYEKIGREVKNITSELPFEIPDNWVWIKLKDLIDIQTGASFKKEVAIAEPKANYIRVLRGGNISPFQCSLKSDDLYIPKELAQNNILLNKNDLLTPAVTSLENIGKICRLEISMNSVTAGGFVYIFRPYLDNDILSKLFMHFFSSPNYQEMLKHITKKSGQAFYNINKERLKSLYFPLPPFNEGKRILDRLATFEPLLTQYVLIESSLSQLEYEFEEKLKASILQYAIEGKLVKQDPNDEPASKLLKRIKEEKEKLIKEGKIKRDKHESEIVLGDDKNYYEKDIPTGWVLANIGQLGVLTRGSGIKRSDITEDGYPCIRYGELYTTYKVSFSSAVSYTSLEIWENALKAKQNDIFMTLTGENKKDISIALAYLGENQIAYGGDMTCLSNHHMNPLYLVYAINSPYGRNCMQQLSTGDIIVHMSNDRLAKIRMPIPPFSEQNRIITKINRIVSLL